VDRWMAAQTAFRVMEIKGEATKARRVRGLLGARRDAARDRSAKRREVGRVTKPLPRSVAARAVI
jgi:hypothetical protein